jgi:hypothetical protein
VALSFSPRRLHFPPQIVLGGQSTTSPPLKVTISHSNNRRQQLPVVIESYSVTGDFALDRKTTDCGFILLPGSKCHVGVTFTPGGNGKSAGSLSVITNATKGLPINVALSGSGQQGALSFRPAAVDFGTLRVKKKAFALVTFKNNNPLPLTITGIDVTKDTKEFVPLLAANGCIRVLAPSSACTISVAFAPTRRGAHSTFLQVFDNAAGSPQMIKMSGVAK